MALAKWVCLTKEVMCLSLCPPSPTQSSATCNEWLTYTEDKGLSPFCQSRTAMCPFCSRAQAEPRLQPRTHVCLLFFSHSAMPDSSQPHVIAACQPSLSSTSFLSLLKLMSSESGVPSNHLILCRPLLLLLSIFPSIKGCLLSSFLSRFPFSLPPQNIPSMFQSLFWGS